MASGNSFQISGVLLDMDGLLLDSESWTITAGPAIFARHGLHLSEAFFQSLVGISDHDSARLMSLETGKAVTPEFVDQTWHQALMEMREPVGLRPGVHAFLDALESHGLPFAIATNATTARAEWKLKSAGLAGRVPHVVGRDQVANGKPAPDVYVAAARRLGVPPGACAALEDSDPGVRAALSAGCAIVIQVPDTVPSAENLAHHQAPSLDAAREILGI